MENRRPARGASSLPGQAIALGFYVTGNQKRCVVGYHVFGAPPD